MRKKGRLFWKQMKIWNRLNTSFCRKCNWKCCLSCVVGLPVHCWSRCWLLLRIILAFIMAIVIMKGMKMKFFVKYDIWLYYSWVKIKENSILMQLRYHSWKCSSGLSPLRKPESRWKVFALNKPNSVAIISNTLLWYTTCDFNWKMTRFASELFLMFLSKWCVGNPWANSQMCSPRQTFVPIGCRKLFKWFFCDDKLNKLANFPTFRFGSSHACLLCLLGIANLVQLGAKLYIES